MPDLAYWLFSLAMTPDERSLPVWERVVSLLTPTEDNLRDRFSGTFSYVDAIGRAADRWGDPAMVPLLERLHAHAPLRDQVSRCGFQPDFFAERQAMLEIGIARALLAERAHSELIDLTGVDHGKDAPAWAGWLVEHRSSFHHAAMSRVWV